MIINCYSQRCRALFKQLKSDQHYCSKKCKDYEAVRRSRRKKKEKAVDYKGGKCQRCGYSKCLDALAFHHIDPKTKKFTISLGIARGFTWTKLKLEIDQCELLCANCHHEEHGSSTNTEELPDLVPEKPLPRYRHVYISKEELERLVWEIPTVKIAEMYGISDVAIAKKCAKFGIAKPTRGYWSKYKAV